LEARFSDIARSKSPCGCHCFSVATSPNRPTLSREDGDAATAIHTCNAALSLFHTHRHCWFDRALTHTRADKTQVDDGTGEQGAGGGEIQVATPKLAPPPGGGAGTDGGVVSASTPATASSASTKRRPKPRGLASGFGPVRARAAAAAAPAAPPRVEAADASDSEFDI